MKLAAAILIASAALLLTAPAVPAAAGVTADGAPTVSISVSDGREDAEPGDQLDYTVQVENAGAEVFAGSVTLRVPEFAEVEASGAIIDGSVATWNAEIPAGGSAQWEATAIVGDDPGDAYQIVVLAEVADARGAVVVRAADADAILGAAAPPAVAGLTGPDPGLPEWVVPAGIVTVVILAGSSVALFGAVLARRQRPRAG